jgi:NADH:ubiquinone oxidoreductase subunit 6 (subunit J)
MADAGSFLVVLFFYLREIKLIAKHLEVVRNKNIVYNNSD